MQKLFFCLVAAFLATGSLVAQNHLFMKYRGSQYELTNGAYSRESDESANLRFPKNVIVEYSDDHSAVRIFDRKGFETLFFVNEQGTGFDAMYGFKGGLKATANFYNGTELFGILATEKVTKYSRLDLYEIDSNPGCSYENATADYLASGGRPSKGVAEDIRLRQLEQPCPLAFYHYFLTEPTCAFGGPTGFASWIERSVKYQYPDVSGTTEINVVIPAGGGKAKYEYVKTELPAEIQQHILSLIELVTWRPVSWTTAEFHKEYRGKPGECQCVYFSVKLFK